MYKFAPSSYQGSAVYLQNVKALWWMGPSAVVSLVLPHKKSLIEYLEAYHHQPLLISNVPLQNVDNEHILPFHTE